MHAAAAAYRAKFSEKYEHRQLHPPSPTPLPPSRTTAMIHAKTSLVVLLAALSAPLAAGACAYFGKDHAAVMRVQASWDPAELAMNDGEYAKALAELRATAKSLPSIRNSFTRSCVAGGSNLRIASAAAGAQALASDPNDLARARASAQRAWLSYPMAHNCP